MRDSFPKGTILVTGALGQIGSELLPELAKRYPKRRILGSDVKESAKESQHVRAINFVSFDVTDKSALTKIVKEEDVGTIFHLAGILSANGEIYPERTLSVNILGLRNVLEVAKERRGTSIFWPSSIAVFGRGVPKFDVPQNAPLFPETVYGITKVTGELLCSYYFEKHGLDVRSLRFPGIISSKTLPGGGTTDYAVEIFYDAIRVKRYTCFVNKDTVLPMLYIPDCISGIIEVMEADLSALKSRRSYNLGGLKFSAEDLAKEVKKYIPEFRVEYKPDYRMKIAETWPSSIDDSVAKREWGWKVSYDLESMTKDMMESLSSKIKNSRKSETTL